MVSGKTAVNVLGAEQGITTVPILRDGDVELQRAVKGEMKHADSTRSLEQLGGLSEEEPRKERSSLRSFGIAATTVLAMSLNSGSASALNIALPTMGEDLNINDDELQWFISAYSLTFGCCLLLSGRLADCYGRKRIFMVGITWMMIWTILGGVIPNMVGIVVARALAGVGASITVPSAIGIIAHNFHGRARSLAFASFSCGAPIGGGIGLILGGLLTIYAPVGWKAIFYVNGGLAALTGILGFLLFPADEPNTSDKRIDWTGAGMITVGLVLLQYVLSGGEAAPDGWKTGYIIALLLISVFMIAAFFGWEHRVATKTSKPPLMRLQLWTRARGKLAAVYAIAFFAWCGFTSLLFHSTLYFQQVQELSALQTMIRFLPTCIFGVIYNVMVGFLASRVSAQLLIIIGTCATGLANLMFAIADPQASYWHYGFQAMWLGVMGADFLMACGMIFVAKLALPEEQSVAGALFQTLVQLGGSLGLALTTLVNTVFTNKSLASGATDAEARLKGLQAAFWLGAGFAWFSMVVAIVALRGMGAVGSKGKEDDLVDDEASQRARRD